MDKSELKKAPAVFISYSHSDSEWVDRLRVHFKAFEKWEKPDLWYDRKISFGERWDPEIDNAIRSSQLAVLFISPGFLASDYIVSRELPDLLKRASKEDLQLISIVVSPVSKNILGEIGKYQLLNLDKPLNTLNRHEQDAALERAVRIIHEALQRKASSCYVLTSFGEEGGEIREAILDTLLNSGVRPVRTEEVRTIEQSVTEVVYSQIRDSDFVIADLSSHNLNVYYELGIIYALGKPVFLLTQERADKLPPFLSDRLFLVYDPKDLESLKRNIAAWIPRLIQEAKEVA